MAKNELVIVEGEHILKNLSLLNRHMNIILGRVVDPHLKKHFRSFMNTQSDMKKRPGRVARPIDWETEKQRRWAGWAIGQGILPSRRTGELYRHFDVIANRFEGLVAIVNTAEYAKYVIGDRQQRFHKNTGYKKLSSYEDELLKSSIPVASKGLDSEIRQFLFKKGLL
jgi:hypothetical protein